MGMAHGDPTLDSLRAARRRKRLQVAGCVVLSLVAGAIILGVVFPQLWRPAVARDYRDMLETGPVSERDLLTAMESRRLRVISKQSRFDWSRLRSEYGDFRWTGAAASPGDLDKQPPRIVAVMCYEDLYAAATGGRMSYFTLLVDRGGVVVAWRESK